MRPTYDDEDRFIAYWHQSRLVMDLKPRTLLEVGKGNGFLSDYVRARGIETVTLDFDEKLTPTVVGSVLNLPFKDDSFDDVVAFEVLEHIPYENFQTALNEMKRVAKNHVVISVLDASRVFLVNINIYGISNKWFRLPFPSHLRVGGHLYDGQHYWEIGKTGYHLDKISKDIERSGLEIVKSYRAKRAPFCRFFVLVKKERSEQEG